MRLFFMGSTLFGLRCLKAALECGIDLVGCAHTPQVFPISYAPEGVRNVNYFDFSVFAKELGVKYISYYPDRIQEFASEVKKLEPDIILVAGWYYIIPVLIRNIPHKGVLGLHSSLLPKYRGGAPLVWAIINGEEATGVSLFYLEEGVDTGDIVGQEQFSIEKTDTIMNLLTKSENAAQNLIRLYLPQISNGCAPRIPQDHSQATYYSQRKPQDGEIDWSKSNRQISDFIRAQTKPYPGAFTKIQGKKVIIWDADIIDEEVEV